MKRNKYFKEIRLNLSESLWEYLNWKSEKLDRSISEIVQDFIMEDINNNGLTLLHGKSNMNETTMD